MGHAFLTFIFGNISDNLGSYQVLSDMTFDRNAALYHITGNTEDNTLFSLSF